MAFVLVLPCLFGCGEDTVAPDPTPTNHAPGQPAINTTAGAPADGATDVSISQILYWQCSDPDGDALTFDVHFGQSSPPAAVSTGQSGESYNAGTLAYSTLYYWKIVAKDPGNKTTSSAEWSFTTMDAPVETVSAPDAPTGPASGETGANSSYSTGGAVSSMGHTVEYRFDWGDGNISAWAIGTSGQHSWSAAGSYDVKAQARCQAHPAVESAWSAATTVTITSSAETVGTPDTPTGPTTAETGDNLFFSTEGAASSLGHSVAYRFDWGDGNISAWTSSGNFYKVFTAAGSYDVKAQARCQDHTAIESAWSAALTVTVTVAPEIVTKPTITSFPTVGGVGDEQSFFANYANSSENHALEHRYDFGDGTISAWDVSRAGAHTYSTAGTYEVRAQARCATHTDIESNWSDAVSLEISSDAETISTPIFTRPADNERTVTVGNGIYCDLDASSSVGHILEYRFDWGTGFISAWSTAHSKTSPAYVSVGDYVIKAQARCRDHTGIESAWSGDIPIQVVESISRPDISGPPTGTVGQEITFTTNGSTSSEGHELEYRLYISFNYFTSGSPQEWTSIDSLTYTFTSARTMYVRVQARCKTDLVESIVSDYTSIIITNP
jgi:hypothetical protein